MSTQVKVLKYLFLKVLEYQEYKITFSKYCITCHSAYIYGQKHPHGVMKNVNVQILENVKGI